MSEELRKSLDAIDNIRRRVLAGGWLAVLVTLGMYARLYYVLESSPSVQKAIGASVAAVTCLIAWTSFAVILIVIRMAKRILIAIELTARHDAGVP